MQENIIIERVNRDNYHVFDDIICWRMKSIELPHEENMQKNGISTMS